MEFQASEWSSRPLSGFPIQRPRLEHSECRFLRRLHHHIHLNSEARADIYDGGTASYHLGMAFLCSSPQIGNIAEYIQMYTDASGTFSYGAYLDGAWFRGNCPHAPVPQKLAEL